MSTFTEMLLDCVKYFTKENKIIESHLINMVAMLERIEYRCDIINSMLANSFTTALQDRSRYKHIIAKLVALTEGRVKDNEAMDTLSDKIMFLTGHITGCIEYMKDERASWDAGKNTLQAEVKEARFIIASTIPYLAKAMKSGIEYEEIEIPLSSVLTREQFESLRRSMSVRKEKAIVPSEEKGETE